MNNPYKIWAVRYNGKRMHVMYATRLPRKLKKFIKMLFDMMEDRYDDFLVVSPSFGEMTEEWVSTSSFLANVKNESFKNSGPLPNEQ